MKNKKNIIFITIIVLIVIGMLLFNQYKLSNKGSIFTASKEHKNYKVVCLSGNIGNITDEHYIIIDENRKVVEVRKITTGYTDDELNNAYKEITTNDTYEFNAEIRGKSLVRSSIVPRGQDVDIIINGFKSSYTNVIVKEI